MKILMKDVSPRDQYAWMTASIVPRPIAFVSTLSEQGVPNLAPFSYFNGVSSRPPILSIAVGPRRGGREKDTLVNLKATGELTVNVVTEAMAESMVKTSGDFEPDVDEFEVGKFSKVRSEVVKPFRVAESPLAFECGLVRVVDVGEPATALILAEILVVHADDAILTDGLPDARKLRPLARLGGIEYASLGELIRIPRPTVTGEGK